MSSEFGIKERRADIELHVLVRLCEADIVPCDLPFSAIVDLPIDAVDRNEVCVRLEFLKREEWVTGEIEGEYFRSARLSPAARAAAAQIGS